jgi:cytochrome d ubiquinol oxidase subunit II
MEAWAMTLDLTLIWAVIIAFVVFMYVLMDGFDLGIGILFPFAQRESDRDTMMNSVAPFWDGNETWLVMGGTGLLAAFPLAYGIILPALYIPIMIMLIALIFRGVAFEFRFKATASRHLWDKAFHYGSLVATVAQGVTLGAFIEGFAVQGRDYVGGPFAWASWMSLIAALGLISGYALLAAGWLILKTEGDLQSWAYRIAKPLLLAVLVAFAVVSIATPLAKPEIAARWFSWPNIAYLSPVPLITLALAIGIWRALDKRREKRPFVFTMALFALSYLGLAISLWPKVVPPDITIWQAAAARESQIFFLVGAAVLIPILLTYTSYNYWVFRGKVRGEGYHQ